MKTIRYFVLALLFAAVLPVFGQTTYYIGKVIEFSDGTKGVVFSLNRDRMSGTVVAMNDYAGDDRSWSAGFDDVTQLTDVDNVLLALSHRDGYANTCAVRYQADWAGSKYAYPAFTLLLDDGNYKINSKPVKFNKGWYQPSAGQLREIFGALSIAGFEEALTQTMGNYNYHSSDEYYSWQNGDIPNSLSKFWACTFRDGQVRPLKKNYYENINGAATLHRNRAVRDFPETTSVKITVKANNNSYGRVLGSGYYLPNHTIRIGAKPNKGYKFQKWNDGDTHNPREITVTGAAEYKATFAAITDKYTLTVKTCSSTMGNVTGGGNYTCGTTRTITATPKSGYKFVRWSDGNTSASREVTVYGDVTYTAAFASAAANAPRVHIGDILCTDGATVAPADFAAYISSHTGVAAKAVVYYVDKSGQHGYAIHPRIYPWTWGGYNIDVEGLDATTENRGISDTIGAANTDKICAFFGDCMVAASACRSFGPEWFLPAQGQINYLYAMLPKVQQGIDAIIASGGDADRWPENNEWWIWSSSERSPTHAYFLINSGVLSYEYKYAYACSIAPSCVF